jgi:predicted ATPase
MLKNLTLRNFRAFRRQDFAFSRINVFVGPNNSGKSSAISAINLIAQTVMAKDQLGGPLVLNGQFDELGTFIDLVHGNRSNTPLGIDFAYGDNAVSLEFKYRTQRREIELSKFDLQRRSQAIFSYSVKKDSYEMRFAGQRFEALAPGVAKRRPEFVGFWPLDRGFLFRYRLNDDLKKRITKKSWDVLRHVEFQMSRAWRDLQLEFKNFDSLSPFRDPPQRTYLFTGETPQYVGRTGSNSVNLLLTDTSRRGSAKTGIVDEISRWFQVTNIAKQIKVRSLTPRHFEICLVSNDGTEHNICDVGFGCSQVLPVLTAGLHLFIDSSPGRHQPMLVVQEPEIHLHPHAQAALGSFFAGLARRGGQLFIETHSDNLILRLARHVASGQLPPDALRIFFFEERGGEKEVRQISVTNEGLITSDWPGGFFPQRQSESLALAKAAAGEKNPTPEQLTFIYPEEG